jgi:hypothetical protein
VYDDRFSYDRYTLRSGSAVHRTAGITGICRSRSRACRAFTAIPAAMDAGYPFVNTEFDFMPDWAKHVKRYEEMEIGWMCFRYLVHHTNMEQYRKEVDDAGLTWCNDYGTWPMNSAACSPNVSVSVTAGSPVRSEHGGARSTRTAGSYRLLPPTSGRGRKTNTIPEYHDLRGRPVVSPGNGVVVGR